MFLLTVGQAVSVELETRDLVCEIKFLILSHMCTGSVASSQKQEKQGVIPFLHISVHLSCHGDIFPPYSSSISLVF